MRTKSSTFTPPGTEMEFSSLRVWAGSCDLLLTHTVRKGQSPGGCLLQETSLPCLSGTLPQAYDPSLTGRNNGRQTQTEGHTTKYLTRTPQICQGHERQRKTEKLSQTGRDQRDMTDKRNGVSWIGSWNRKRTLVGKQVGYDKVRSSVNTALTNIHLLVLTKVRLRSCKELVSMRGSWAHGKSLSVLSLQFFCKSKVTK